LEPAKYRFHKTQHLIKEAKTVVNFLLCIKNNTKKVTYNGDSNTQYEIHFLEIG